MSWKREGQRHSLASKGIKTTNKQQYAKGAYMTKKIGGLDIEYQDDEDYIEINGEIGMNISGNKKDIKTPQDLINAIDEPDNDNEQQTIDGLNIFTSISEDDAGGVRIFIFDNKEFLYVGHHEIDTSMGGGGLMIFGEAVDKVGIEVHSYERDCGDDFSGTMKFKHNNKKHLIEWG